MNHVELKCMRESLHLTVTQLASLVNVTERTVRYWETNKFKAGVPVDVSDVLEEMNLYIDQQTDSIGAMFPSDDGTYELQVFLDDASYQASDHYMPQIPFASLHRCLKLRIKKAVLSRGTTINLVYDCDCSAGDWKTLGNTREDE